MRYWLFTRNVTAVNQCRARHRPVKQSAKDDEIPHKDYIDNRPVFLADLFQGLRENNISQAIPIENRISETVARNIQCLFFCLLLPHAPVIDTDMLQIPALRRRFVLVNKLIKVFSYEALVQMIDMAGWNTNRYI
jgi:hypothetical protein